MARDAARSSCNYAGTRHRPGDSFADADGCNVCFCDPSGEVACTLALCVDAAPELCSYRGHGYALGAAFPAGDGCNTCFCPPSGRVGCTRRQCEVAGSIDVEWSAR